MHSNENEQGTPRDTPRTVFPAIDGYHPPDENPFMTDLCVRLNMASTTMTSTREFVVCLVPMGTIIVPPGFPSDGASTNGIGAVYPAFGRRYTLPAFVHDYLYSNRAVIMIDGRPIVPDRRTADAILRQLMRRNGCRWWTCWIFWAAVRLFGSRHWHH